MVGHYGDEWPLYARELAFEVWLLECGRNMVHTAARLREEDYGLPIPRPTLAMWRRNDDWDQRADEKSRQLAPGHRERTLANITLAAFHGSSYLVAVNAGAVKADKSRLNGVRLALDAAGLVGAARERLNAALASGQVARVLALSDEERARVRALLGLGDGVDVIDVPADAERDIDPDS